MEFSEFEARKHNVAPITHWGPITTLVHASMPCQILPNLVVYEPSINCYIYSNLKASLFSPKFVQILHVQYQYHFPYIYSNLKASPFFFKFVQTLPVQYQFHFPYIMSLALYTMALMRGPWLALLWFIVDGIWSKRRDEWTVQASYDKVHTYKWLFSYLYIYSWS